MMPTRTVDQHEGVLSMNPQRLLATIALLLAGTPAFGAPAPGSCASLASLALPNARVTSAVDVPAGTFVQPAGGANAAATKAFAALPAFCRVLVTATPTSDSDIKVEVWLPVSGWNGKFQAVGNGGWGGTIAYPALAAAVAGGYASASTDTGHSTPGAAFAVGHPEKLIDFAHRGVHEMTLHAKAAINAYYGTGPSLSLWTGCSTGGRQGITAASRYPGDFDAIIAGASPDPLARLHGVRVALNRMVHRAAGSYIPPEKYAVVHQAVLDACDKLDGVRDGVLESPSRCRFDPKVLECKGADGPSCLTQAQVETARALYAPVKHPRNGRILYSPLLQYGSELNWATLAGPNPFGNAVEGMRFVLFNDANWDPRTFNPATDIDQMDKAGAVLDAAHPNLRPFFDRGGRLLMYHGWNDQQVPATSSVNYYNRVLEAAGKEAAGKSIQLYMVPGMNHCQGGVGTDTFDRIAAMDQWIAQGRAPAEIIASHSTGGKVDRTRPLCPYPQVARYKGNGSTDAAVNFSCALP
jgi:feruloyl esterase